MERPFSPEVEERLQELGPEETFNSVRKSAAKKLGQLSDSHPRIVQALLDAMASDPAPIVRREAARSLGAPAHQQVLQGHPELLDRWRQIQVSQPDLVSYQQKRLAPQEPAEPGRDETPELVEDLPLDFSPRRAAAPPATGWRLALAAIYGLVAALGLGYLWYLVGNATNTRFGYAALVLGLGVGAVVSFMAGGSQDPRYSLLGAALAGVGVAYGELLIFGMPGSRVQFELGPVDLLIWGLALYEGWVVPRRVLGFVQGRSHVINEGNRRPIMTVGVVVLVALIGLGAATGQLPTTETVGAKSHFDRATDLYEDDQISRAKSECEKAIELKPDYADAHAMLGLIYLEEGDLFSAISSFDEAIDLGMIDEDLTVIYAFRGLCYAGISLYEEALVDMDAAIDLDDENGLAYYGRGAIYYLMEEPEKAIPDLEKALILDLDDGLKQDARTMLEDLR